LTVRRRRQLVIGLGLPGLLALLVLWQIQDPAAEVTTEEQPAPDEAVVIARLVQKAKAAVAQRALPDGLYKRDAHPFAHGCARAQLVVDDAIDERLRYGVFARPGKYDAWVRFSNGLESDDNKRDARGMSIKLLGVDGPRLLPEVDEPPSERVARTQDFVMIDYPAFFTRTLEDYERFFEIQSTNPKPYRFFFSLNPFKLRLHEFYHATRMIYRRVVNPLEAQYYSMAAFRQGPRNVKFSVRPCAASAGAPAEPKGPTRLRSALSRSLSSAPACYSFLVQVQDPRQNMPIEDATIEWRESLSPFLHVATLIIPRQEIDTEEKNRFCEDLSFSPWHGVADHRPVGAMNRARRAVYQAIAQFRHQRNGVPFPALVRGPEPAPNSPAEAN
jgi:hypothetical protein